MTPSNTPTTPRHGTKLDPSVARYIITRSVRPLSPAQRLVNYYKRAILAQGIHYRNNGDTRYEPKSQRQ